MYVGIALKWRVININSELRVSYILAPPTVNLNGDAGNRVQKAYFLEIFALFDRLQISLKKLFGRDEAAEAPLGNIKPNAEKSSWGINSICFCNQFSNLHFVESASTFRFSIHQNVWKQNRSLRRIQK